MEIDILSLFPDYFSGPFDESILKRALGKGLLTIRHVNIRDFAKDKHHRVDDRPFGGGPGMVLMAPPIADALRSVHRPDSYVVYLSPQGEPLTAKMCQALAERSHLVVLCGHYEGIDERILAREVDKEISIGDYVLTNGALAAIVLIDAMARFIPGVIGNPDAAAEDSFQTGLLDCPHYTRPEVFEGERVPGVLLKGNHEDIAEWRYQQALRRTQHRRPDLYYSYVASQNDIEAEKDPLSVLGTVEWILPVRDVQKTVVFFKKALGTTAKIDDKTAYITIGNTNIMFIHGEPAAGIGIKCFVENTESFHFLSLRLAKLSCSIEKLLTKAEEIQFQDLNGYHWIFKQIPSKGD